MVCIFCGTKTRVVNSRCQVRLKQVWRRRQCPKCFNVFTTIERVDLAGSLMVANRSGKINNFVKEKLLLSIYDSLKHRDHPIEDAVAIAETIISNVLRSLKGPVINRDSLVAESFKVLNRFDKAAAVHYRAYYPFSTDNL